jgi:hypothetical protein
MSHTAKDLGLHGYKNWLKSLKPLPNGTVVRFKTGYSGVTKSTTISPNQELIIQGSRLGLASDALYYDMVVYRNGKVFTKKMAFSIESIARWLIDGDCDLVEVAQ